MKLRQPEVEVGDQEEEQPESEEEHELGREDGDEDAGLAELAEPLGVRDQPDDLEAEEEERLNSSLLVRYVLVSAYGRLLPLPNGGSTQSGSRSTRRESQTPNELPFQRISND